MHRTDFRFSRPLTALIVLFWPVSALIISLYFGASRSIGMFLESFESSARKDVADAVRWSIVEPFRSLSEKVRALGQRLYLFGAVSFERFIEARIVAALFFLALPALVIVAIVMDLRTLGPRRLALDIWDVIKDVAAIFITGRYHN